MGLHPRLFGGQEAPADPSLDPLKVAAMTVVTAGVMNTPDAYTLR